MRRTESLGNTEPHCILEDAPGGYIKVESDDATKEEFEVRLRSYLLEYELDAIEFLDVQESLTSEIDADIHEGVKLGTLHTYGADDA